MKDLYVISEPEIILNEGCRNNALNEILKHYSKYNTNVRYISSSDSDAIFSKDGVDYVSLSKYSKRKRNILGCRREVKSFFANALKDDNVHFQFRLPSMYALQVYFLVRNILPDEKVSFYIAGDWKESLKYNYPKYPLLSYILPTIQDRVLRNKLCVFTGEELLIKNHMRISKGLDFYSTTHTINDVDTVPISKFRTRAICFIGRIEKLKNYNFMLSMARSELGEDYHFHWLGDGPDRSELEGAIKKNQLTNITLHGHVSDRRKFNEIVDKCKYFVLSSYTEGTSKTLPEMMCRSIVPIAFDNVGSNSKILSYGNGVLVNVDDCEMVVKKILEIDCDQSVYQSILDSGNKYAREHTIEIQLKRMFEFLYSSDLAPRK
ncbi:glycosyl hydrolase family 1 [Enterovibrio norvegicus FF-162]|uniref:glycosyltransferase n=1 Tax=Enterovibrio norvegicus TaxID=188144 RepID=UPI000307E870|nr:glycosyltransferase [Enterovibrio norvegicus]OEE86163.1 glycosyl hydrolase family 1 [Enterovibrio norvegicus FF-162]